MLPDISSATAFAPLLPPVLHEPAGCRGVGTGPDSRLRRVGIQYSSNSLPIAALPLHLASERAVSALAGEKPREHPDKSHTVELSKRVQFLRMEAEFDRVPFSDASL